MARPAPILFAVVALSWAAACGGSEDDATTASGGAAGNGTGAQPSGGSGGSSGSDAGGGVGATGGAPSGGGGGIDLDGAVLEGSLDVIACTPPTSDSDCDTFPQCGCELGQKCDVLDLSTGRAACTQDGPVQQYQTCGSLFGQCQAGGACLGGACKPLCESDADCPGANRKCRQVEIFKNNQNNPVPGMFTCTAGCDPINPGLACGSGLNCLFAGTGTTDCYGAGTGVGPGTCSQGGGLACAAGYTCINTTQPVGSYSCLKWCRLTANDCSSGFVCKDLSSKPVLGGVEYGACFAL